jgi:hypothetical protein
MSNPARGHVHGIGIAAVPHRRGARRHAEAVIRDQIRRLSRAFSAPVPGSGFDSTDRVIERPELGERPTG